MAGVSGALEKWQERCAWLCCEGDDV